MVVETLTILTYMLTNEETNVHTFKQTADRRTEK